MYVYIVILLFFNADQAMTAESKAKFLIEGASIDIRMQWLRVSLNI